MIQPRETQSLKPGSAKNSRHTDFSLDLRVVTPAHKPQVTTTHCSIRCLHVTAANLFRLKWLYFKGPAAWLLGDSAVMFMSSVSGESS